MIITNGGLVNYVKLTQYLRQRRRFRLAGMQTAYSGCYTLGEVSKMLCQKCHKNLATLRYAEVVGGKVSDLQLCAECMNRMQDEAASGFELAGIGAAKVKQKQLVEAPAESPVPHRVCRSCGTDLKEAIQLSRVGCSSCYDALGDSLEQVLRGFHVGMRHRGKEPHITDARKVMRSELHSLRALLRSTLKSENYEEAAKLRDRIKTLEETMDVRQNDRIGTENRVGERLGESLNDDTGAKGDDHVPPGDGVGSVLTLKAGNCCRSLGQCGLRQQ